MESTAMLNDKGENLTGPGSCALPRVGPDGAALACWKGYADRASPSNRISPFPFSAAWRAPPSLRSFLKGPYYTLVKLQRSPCVRGAAESQKEGGGGGARAGWGGGVNPLLAPFKSVRASADSSLADPLTCRGWRASSRRS